jgi:hypothetical protein
MEFIVHLIDHARCMVDMEASERCGLRQCAPLGVFLIQRHLGRGVTMGGRGSLASSSATPLD